MKGALHRTIDAESIAILTAYYGAGISLRIPWTTANAAHLEILIGLEQTSRLVQEFGGTSVYLPGVPPRKSLGNKDLPPSLSEVNRLSAKLTAAQIAKRFGCSVRSVFSKRARIKARSHERTSKGKLAPDAREG